MSFQPLELILAGFLALLTIAILLSLAKVGGGKHIITIRRKAGFDTEQGWQLLQEAWQRNAFSFKPSRFLETEDQDVRILVNAINGKASEHILRRLPTEQPMTIAYQIRRDDKCVWPAGDTHFEEWSVVGNGDAAQIIVRTRFRKGLLDTARTLLALWRHAGILVAANAHEQLVALDTLDHIPARSRDPYRPSYAYARTSSSARGNYGREAVLSLVAFAYLLTQYSFQSAVALAAVILWHEFGHLVAYRLTGKTGNRLMLVPFFGGLAVAGAPHKSEFEKAFCALMGPGICAPLTLGCYAIWYYTDNDIYSAWAWQVLYFSSALNLLNLLPIYPLDGGQAAETYLRSFFPTNVFNLLVGLSLAGFMVLAYFQDYRLLLFVAIFALIGLKNLPSHSPLKKMTGGQTAMVTLLYAAIAAAHGWVFYAISTY
jgi:Zn-dependent protease